MRQQRLGIGGHHRAHSGGARDVWLTPPGFIEALGPFDLDPCAADEPRPWSTADTHYTADDDGLAQPWVGFVWCNPPYSQIDAWMRRMADHDNGLAMVFARTETRWFVDHVWGAALGIAFLHGRLHFYDSRGQRALANAGGPTAIVAYGADALARLDRIPWPRSMTERWI